MRGGAAATRLPNPTEEDPRMKKTLTIALLAAFAAVGAHASDCESKAVSKDGKPLAGAAKASFIKKCEADAKG